MNIDKQILLADAKKEEMGIKEKIDPDGKSKNSVDLLLRSFNYFLNNRNNSGRDYENREFAKGIYSVIGWGGEREFDVINSFYTNFKSALVYCGALNKKTPTEYSFDENNRFCYRTAAHGMVQIRKRKLVEKMVNPEYSCAKSLPFFMESEIGKTAGKFAALCDCVANFMPCPDKEFNSAKGGLDLQDYLPLMVDKIQQCVQDECKFIYYEPEKKGDIVVPFNTIVNWHKWLVDNREKYCLDPYYKIENGKIAGIPLFENQSLENPIPMEADEVKVCLEAIINWINVRADLILERYQSKP